MEDLKIVYLSTGALKSKADNSDESIMTFEPQEQAECAKLFTEYAEANREIY